MDTKERKKLHRWEQKNRWMAHYELKYGVLPIEYGPPAVSGGNGTPPGGSGYALDTTPTVLKAKCRFCECFGREALASELLNNKAVAAAAAAAAGIEFPGSPIASSGEALEENSSNAGDLQANGQPPLKRRKKRQTLKVFGPNFRTDNLESHLTREHPIKWKEYERLRDSEKKAFFPDGAGDAASKELLLAQQAAVANGISTVGLSRSMAVNSSTGGALLHTSSAGLKLPGGASYGASLDKVLLPVTKQMVSTEIMVLVEQLLATSALRQQQASLQQDAATLAAVNWPAFVREDDRLADLAAAMAVNLGEAGAANAANAAAGSVITGECKAVSSDYCTIALKNEALFLYIVEVLSARQSLDTTLTMVHAAQRLVPDAALLLQGMTLADLSGMVHQLMGLNLSSISQLMSYAWGYSLFLRFLTHHGTGFLDVRVQVAANDEIHDLHLVAIPLDETKHTVESVGGMVVKALTAVDARALEKVVGLTIDGDHFHMHKYKSIGAWIKKQTEDVTSQAAFYVLYNGAYHISFIVDELLDHCQADQEFLTSLAEVEALCRGNMSLSAAMGPEPTRFTSAHWVSIFNACEWLTVHRDTILKWGAENQQQFAKLPSIQWWVTLYVLRDVLKDVYVAYKKCRESCSSFADVQKYLRDLIFQIRLKFNMTPALPSDATATASGTPSSTAASDLAASLTAAPSGASIAAADQLDPCEFSYQDFVNFVIPLDLFMYDAFQVKTIDGINDVDRVALYQRFHLVLMLLINKVLAVINSSPDSPVPPAATDATANACGADAVGTPHQYAMQIPPSTPYEFITINNLTAMDMLNQQRFRIRSKWTGKVLSMITEDRNRMMAEYSHPGALYEAVIHGMKQYESGAFSFRDAWKPFSVEFASLASFAIVFGGLLSVTRTTEDELEHYFYTMNKYAGSNLALEAQLHASQFHKLSALRRHGDATIV